MFQFPGLASPTLCIQVEMTTEVAGFPHSEISGSKLVCQLPEAYRRLLRPSSPPAAKASTVCAYSLDHTTPNSLFGSIRRQTTARKRTSEPLTIFWKRLPRALWRWSHECDTTQVKLHVQLYLLELDISIHTELLKSFRLGGRDRLTGT